MKHTGVVTVAGVGIEIIAALALAAATIAGASAVRADGDPRRPVAVDDGVSGVWGIWQAR
ncbi:MAG: hypothetical protein QM736_14070 [Vicinamibacterales bacterium]